MTNPRSIDAATAGALAALFPTDTGARGLLAVTGFPADQIPAFTNALDFWRLITAEIEKGVIESPAALIRAASAQYPSNQVLRAWLGGASQTANRLFQLPAALGDFVGRKKPFEQIVSRLRGAGGKVGVSALRGMGGVGKTSLAVLAAHAVKDQYPDAQLFLELRGVSDSPVSAVEAMSRIIRDFHPESGKLPDTVDELLPVYRGVLSGKRALVVLDNARDEAQVGPLLTAGPPVAFLLTSRKALRFVDVAVDGIRLDVLPPDESLEMLREIVKAERPDPELRAVAELCGYLPLALRVAGSYLATSEDCATGDYLEDLERALTHLDEGMTEDDRKVQRVLSHSARVLVREDAGRAGRWQALSVFPADFDAAAAAAVWGVEEKAGRKDLHVLHAQSMVEYDEPTRRYSLHDLMRPVAREAFDPLLPETTERLLTAERRFARHYCTVLGTADNLYLKGGENVLAGLGVYDSEATNIRHGWTWAFAQRDTDSLGAELCGDYSDAGADVIELRLPASERIVWLEASVDACRKFGHRRGEGAALGNLGIAHARLGDDRVAIAFHEQALAIAREIGDPHGEGAALGNLGSAHFALGDARVAMAFYEQHRDIAREIGNRRGEGNAASGLGVAHFALGDARVAIAFHEQHLSIAREIGDRRGEGMALGNLGIAHRSLGDARAAITFSEQRLVIAREIGDRRGEGAAFWNMALALDSLGQRTDAIRYAGQALAIAEAIEAPQAEMVRRQLAEWRGEG